MRRPVVLAGFGVAVAVSWWLGRAAGDEAEGPKPWPATSVAIVDMARIFKESPRLTKLREEIRRDFEVESGDMKVLIAELKAIQERSKGKKPDDPELKGIREEFERRSAEAKELGAKLKQEFVTREVETYGLFHEDVRVEIERFAQERGIGLVMRWQESGEVSVEVKDAKDANATMGRINQLVIHQNGLDITDEILERMRDAGSL